MKAIGIIPCFNEEGNIAAVVTELQQQCPELSILVVDDASTDRTSQVAESLIPGQTLRLPLNLGVGGAMQTGLKFALQNDFSFAIKIDGDGQHPPQAIKELLEPLKQGIADIVVGSRFIRNNTGFRSSFFRRVGIIFFELLGLLLTGKRFTDPTSGFRAYNRTAIEFMANHYPTFDYPEPEELVLASKNGLRVTELPVCMRERLSGASTISSSISIYFMLKVTLAMILISLRPPETLLKRKEG